MQMWTYKGVDVFRAGPVVFDNLRWYARAADARAWKDGTPPILRAETKADMRGLITHCLKGRTL